MKVSWSTAGDCHQGTDEFAAATAIIRMPFKPYIPDTYASREDFTASRFEDVVFHFHANDEADMSSKKRKRPAIQNPTNNGHRNALPFRPHQPSFNFNEDILSGHEAVCTTQTKLNLPSATDVSKPLVDTGPLEGDLELPFRPYTEPVNTASATSDCEQEYVQVRKGSTSVSRAPSPGIETGFEFVERPSAVEVLSDNESNSDTMANLEQTKLPAPTGRNDDIESTASADMDSDSEWTML